MATQNPLNKIGQSDRAQRLRESARHYSVKIRESGRTVFRNDMAKVGMFLIVTFVVMAVFAPQIAPHNPQERVITDDGSWVKNHPPSLEYPFGTTSQARPVFSQVVWGSRVAFMMGLLTAGIVGGIGSIVGLVSGYYGGNIDLVLMRVVDVAYGVPFLPFVIVLIMVIGEGSIINMAVAISLLLWRNTARVIRSEVVSIKEQPMIDAARASGASNSRIIMLHIFPKVLPITLLYSIFAVGWAIIAEAGLSFIGLGDPGTISWGKTLNLAHVNQALSQGVWWWFIPPGVAIVLFVMSAYLVAQGIEEVVNPQLREY
jgi:peptide/nickel transport system permease protein